MKISEIIENMANGFSNNELLGYSVTKQIAGLFAFCSMVLMFIHTDKENYVAIFGIVIGAIFTLLSKKAIERVQFNKSEKKDSCKVE